MRVAVLLAFAFGMFAGGALARGLESSPRPAPRPAMIASGLLVIAPETFADLVAMPEPLPLPRPRPRPERLVAQAGLAPVSRPVKRKGGWGIFRAAAARAQPGSERILPQQGAACGDPSIRGEALAPITGKLRGCGIAAPVRVTAVAGVALNPAATIDCETAIALKSWVEQGLQPAFGRNGVVALRVAADYSCRPRNNRPGARISEHGRGKAIDISGFVLADGRALSVKADWRHGQGKPIKVAHRSACGIFGTTLGPGSDGYHKDHLHFDTASYRGGAYCH
ncbi:MAG: extensin family protein [Pseudorhodobacter sp.]|nr:extensin family protein [Pseudorhodobacter sp.]